MKNKYINQSESNKGLIKHLFIISLSLLAYNLSAQGPWSPGKGHGYSQILYNTIPTYTLLFDGANTSRQTERELSETDLVLYTEIGITSKLTIGTTIPYITVMSGDANSASEEMPTLPADKLTSIGNVSLYGKYNLLNSNWNIAVIGQVDIPTSTRSAISGLSTGVDAYTLQPKISAGQSSIKGFYYGYIGYGYRTNSHNDFLNFGIEAGLSTSEKVTLILNVSRLENLANGDPSVDSAANILTGFYTSFQEYTGYILKLYIEKIYKGLGAFGSVGGGGGATSVAASPALSLGVFYKW